MFEFCEECGSIMMHLKDDDDDEFLECTLCGHRKQITEEIHESYVF